MRDAQAPPQVGVLAGLAASLKAFGKKKTTVVVLVGDA